MSKNIVKYTNNQSIKQMKTVEELNKMLPSERITFALEALVEMEQAKGWEVDMSYYHDYNKDTCFACLGGAAAIKALVPTGFSEPIKCSGRDGLIKMLEIEDEKKWDIQEFESSLDSARTGQIGLMFEECGLDEFDGSKFYREIAEYDEDRDMFFEDMTQLADDLKQAGY